MEEGSILPEGLASADAATGPCPSAPLTVAAVLRAAADLIEPEGRWTQNGLALDALGRSTFRTQDAACFCALGAIRQVSGSLHLLEPNEVATAADRAVSGVVGRAVDFWNDETRRTQAEVVAALRAAADLADAISQDGAIEAPVRAETPAKQSGTNDQ